MKMTTQVVLGSLVINPTLRLVTAALVSVAGSAQAAEPVFTSYGAGGAEVQSQSQTQLAPLGSNAASAFIPPSGEMIVARAGHILIADQRLVPRPHGAVR